MLLISALLSRLTTGWKNLLLKPGRPRPYNVFQLPSQQSGRSATRARSSAPLSDSMYRRTTDRAAMCTRGSSVATDSGSPQCCSTCASARRCSASGSDTLLYWCRAVARACTARVRSRSRAAASARVEAVTATALGSRRRVRECWSRRTAVELVVAQEGLAAETMWYECSMRGSSTVGEATQVVAAPCSMARARILMESSLLHKHTHYKTLVDSGSPGCLWFEASHAKLNLSVRFSRETS